MTIAIVIAFCILLLILAFLFPRLSRHPERGGQKVAGAPKRATPQGARQARPLAQQAVRLEPEGDLQEREHRPQGPAQDALLKYPGRDSNPHDHKGQWLLRPSCLTNSTTRARAST